MICKLSQALQFEILSYLKVSDNFKMRGLNKFFLALEKDFFAGDFTSHVVRLQLRERRELQTIHFRHFRLFSLEISQMGNAIGILQVIKGFFQNKCLSLRSLSLGSLSSSIYEEYQSLNDDDLSLIGRQCPNLTSISIHSHYDITEVGLNSLFSQCLQLVALDFSGYKFTHRAFKALKGRNITKACLCTRMLASREDERVSINTDWFTNTQRLQTFSLLDNGVSGKTGEHAIEEDSDLAKLFQNWTLDFFARCISLRDANLSGMTWLNDEIVVALVKKAPLLDSLNLCNRREITDLSMRAIASHCSELSILKIGSCVRITHISIIDVIQKCRKLLTVEASMCLLLDYKALLLELINVPAISLRSLSITFIGQDVIEKVLEKHPLLKIIR